MRTLTFLLFLFSMSSLGAQPQVIPTENGDLTITPVLHGSLVMEWNEHTIYVDPYGGAERYAGFASPDLIVITHAHGDHLNPETLGGLDLTDAEVVAPASVVEKLGDLTFEKVWALANGEALDWQSVNVAAVPMYNLPETEDSRHPKGWGNGYVLTVGGKRIYISGDTEDIPEMRTLENIDVAFVCMNLPYTMDIEQAASAVLDFKPAVMYPYHFRGGGGKLSDVDAFQKMVHAGNPSIEVRLVDWYPER